MVISENSTLKPLLKVSEGNNSLKVTENTNFTARNIYEVIFRAAWFQLVMTIIPVFDRISINVPLVFRDMKQGCLYIIVTIEPWTLVEYQLFSANLSVVWNLTLSSRF